LVATATQFALRPEHEEVTQPTGFDPRAIALFEAIVESAYIVATADGTFDENELDTFAHIVLTCCDGKVTDAQVSDLLTDLAILLAEDGLERRIAVVGETVRRGDHAREVLRMAALMAEASSGVSEVERRLLERLQRSFALGSEVLDSVLIEVRALAQA
jgi:tellurite resistance protein